MNKESDNSSLLNHPLVLIGVAVVAVVVLILVGWKATQAPKYQPSPGVGGRPKVEPPYMKPGAAPPPRQMNN